jgi:YfiH family protein
MSLTIFESKNLSAPRLQHAFFGRTGGVSQGIYAGLNCGQGSRDERSHIDENRRRVAEHFHTMPQQLCTVFQIHSPEVLVISEPTNITQRADAMVTTIPGLILSILTADCAPVLMADAQAGVIAAAHAGWRGAYGGIIENTVQAMLKLGARRQRIAASIGPCIGQDSYEVGPEFIDQITKQDPANAQFFQRRTKRTHAQFDLQGYVHSRLRAAGLHDITSVGMDTFADETRFYSYRRAVAHNESDYGRQISSIMLRERRGVGTQPYSGEERRVR